MEEKPLVTICGYGSLMSKASTLKTFKEVSNFRRGRIKNYRRVFSLVSISSLRQGYSNLDKNELAAVVAYPSEGEDTLVVLFEVGANELEAFYEREHRLKIIEVEYEEESETDNDKQKKALLCAGFTDDEEYIKTKCKDQEDYQRRVGDFYQGKLWREDILPVRKYLCLCLMAAKSIGEDYLDNFMDHSYLADRKTTIRQFLFERIDGSLYLLFDGDSFSLPQEEAKRIEEWRKENNIPVPDNYV